LKSKQGKSPSNLDATQGPQIKEDWTLGSSHHTKQKKKSDASQGGGKLV